MLLKNIPEELVNEELSRLREERVIERIWQRDHRVWSPDPTEIGNRLGWLQSHEEMKKALPEIERFAEDIRSEGINRILLLGMGGSSLAPEVFSKTFGNKAGCPALDVLDTTDPDAIGEAERNCDLSKTLFIVSTKSGGTVETLSLMNYFYNQVVNNFGRKDAGKHFIAITDPGSKLEEKAKSLNFRKTFFNNPEIGGRYSALSYFGLLPAGLLCVDLQALLKDAAKMALAAKRDILSAGSDNAPVILGAVLGALGKTGQDKITLLASEKIKPFGLWLEQLLAESTGKEGKGLLPVDNEPLLNTDRYGQDRVSVVFSLNGDRLIHERADALASEGWPVIRLELPTVYSLGGEMFRWMMATAVAGWSLQINPFDQPDVESAKVLAREMVTAYKEKGRLPEPDPDLEIDGIKVFPGAPRFKAGSLEEAWRGFFSTLQQTPDDFKTLPYVAIQAYLKPDSETDAALQELQHKIGSRYKRAVTVGYGPRYLHSTGQLHKGDAGRGLFIQLTSDPGKDLVIPDEAGSKHSSISFGTLKKAQALGDWQALVDGGRRVIRFHLGEKSAAETNKLRRLLCQPWE